MLEVLPGKAFPVVWLKPSTARRKENPLFVQEVVRYLNEEGLIKREGGKWSGKTGTDLEMSIPERTEGRYREACIPSQ